MDGLPAGGFENWKDGRGWENWRADLGRSLTPDEEAVYRTRLETARRQREAEDAARKAQARAQAAGIWAAAAPCTEHPYLTRKGVHRTAHGSTRACWFCLCATLTGCCTLSSSSPPTARSGFCAGPRRAGPYFAIGEPDGVLCLAEGFATAASIHEATGYAVAVAFDAGNLVPVAVALRAKFPDLRIVALR